MCAGRFLIRGTGGLHYFRVMVMKKWMFLVVFTALMAGSRAFGDVVVDLRAKWNSATTRPDADALAIDVVAVPGHDFSVKYELDHRSIEVSGSLQTLPDGSYQVKINFVDQGNGLESVNTEVEAKMGEEINLAGASAGDSHRTIVMTLKPSGA